MGKSVSLSTLDLPCATHSGARRRHAPVLRDHQDVETTQLAVWSSRAGRCRGTASETLQAELAATEGQRDALRRAFAQLVQAETIRASATDLEAKLATALKDWTALRTKPIVLQRQLLRKLVPDRIVVTPSVEGARKWVDWTGSLLVAPILSGILPALGDDPPPDPMGGRWWPQGAAVAGPFPVRLPLAGTLTLKAA